MSITKIILLVLGIVCLLESLFFLVFGNNSKKLLLKLAKANNLKNVARAELVIAIIFLILSTTL